MALKISLDIVDGHGICRITDATLVRVDDAAESAPDYTIMVTESANPVTRKAAWERRGLLAAQPVRRSIFALCEAACRFAIIESAKP